MDAYEISNPSITHGNLYRMHHARHLVTHLVMVAIDIQLNRSDVSIRGFWIDVAMDVLWFSYIII